MKKLISCLGITILFMLVPMSANADHYVYLYADSNAQVGGGIKENGGTGRWYPYSIFGGSSWNSWRDIKWYTAHTDMRTDMRNAIGDWSTQDTSLGIDWHPWTESSVESGSHVIGKPTSCPQTGYRGCIKVLSWSTMGTQNARYAFEMELYTSRYLPPGYTFASNYLRGVIAHEIGHIYGLHERYDDDVSQGCGADDSIMNGGTTSGSVLTHCSGIYGPAAKDKIRISNFYLGDNYTLKSATRVGNFLNTTWTDKARSDYSLRLQYKKWNGFYYAYQGQADVFTDVGVYDAIENRTIYGSYNVKDTWGTGWYIICGKGWVGTDNNNNEKFTEETCSGSIYFP